MLFLCSKTKVSIETEKICDELVGAGGMFVRAPLPNSNFTPSIFWSPEVIERDVNNQFNFKTLRNEKRASPLTGKSVIIIVTVTGVGYSILLNKL